MARIQGKQLINPISLTGSFSGSFQGDGSNITGVSANTASFAITASHAFFAISASHEIIKEVSSSHANVADTAGGLFGTPTISVNNITSSGNISASGDLIGNGLTIGGSTGPIEVFDDPFILNLASGSM